MESFRVEERESKTGQQGLAVEVTNGDQVKVSWFFCEGVLDGHM